MKSQSVTQNITEPEHNARVYVLTWAALGVVFGDIGTSPLYAFRQCLIGHPGIGPTPENILGILSLILWSLILVVTIKYLLLIMRADNRGEGGILALLALVLSGHARTPKGRPWLVGLGLFGAALLYGDGMITPAISILSAVEGMKIATSVLEPYVLPAASAVLLTLFAVQRLGTQAIGSVFGLVMVLWFLSIGCLGAAWVVRVPEVLVALSPMPALSFMATHGVAGFLVLGSVFLVVTGAEALYADMGHFGRKPIRIAWFGIVLPGLMLNYYGQGALLLSHPTLLHNPFYLLAPPWAIFPLIALATAATVVASQAMISGAFSLTNEALRLGFCPRLEIRHTSAVEKGQIYVPSVNWVLLVGTLGLVWGFQSSDALAGAYGIAVSLTMVITTVLAYLWSRRCKDWGWPTAAAVWGSLLLVDVAFLSSNTAKIVDGGWFPLLVAALVYLLMSTWWQGRAILARHVRAAAVPFELIHGDIVASRITRVPGTAVFLERDPQAVPRTLLHNLKHNKVIHEQVIFLTIVTEQIPRVPRRDRLEIRTLADDFRHIVARFGFMELPSVPTILNQAKDHGVAYDPMSTTFVLGHETLIVNGRPGMPAWRGRVFAVMARNAEPATLHFHIPPNRVIEIGAQVSI